MLTAGGGTMADGTWEQRGVHQMTLVVFAAIRNPVAHQALEFRPEEMLEMLATISFVAGNIADGTANCCQTRCRPPLREAMTGTI